MKKLTPKQERFIDEYMIDLNATQAAIRAGYSKDTAEAMGYKLVHKSLVSEIENAKENISEKSLITLEYVINGLKTVADRCMQRGEEFDASGANQALKLLGDHIGAFKLPDQNVNVHTYEHIKAQKSKYGFER